MGSGLILLVIVGAWLAVLVPMGLRSHDSAVSSRSPERFSDAMRVLARRAASDRAAARAAHGRARSGGSVVLDEHPDAGADLVHPDADAAQPDYDPGPRRTPLGVLRDLRAARAQRRAEAAPLSLAARRRRVLAVLVGLAVLGLAAGLPGPDALLVVGGVAALLAVAFVVHCRREAARRARWRRLRARREAEQRRAAPAVPAPSAPTHVVLRPSAPTVTVGTQPPPRVEPPVPAETVVLPVVQPEEPAAAERTSRPEPRPEPLLPARRIATPEWTPVPVPPPLYVGKAVSRTSAGAAPRRRTAAADTAWSDDPYAGAPARDDAPTVVLDTRRAAGDW